MNLDQQLELSILFEEAGPMAHKRVAVVIGRMNPPTAGHYALIDEVKAFIRKHRDLDLEAAPVIVIIGGSKSDQDKNRNPLTVSEREAFMKASGKVNGALFFSAPNAFEALTLLRSSGYEPIAVATGADRGEDYKTILDKYFLDDNDKPITHYSIVLDRESADSKKKLDSLDDIIKRIKYDGNVEIDEISGSLARRAAELGYEEEFAKIVGLDNKPVLAKKLFDKVVKSIGSK